MENAALDTFERVISILETGGGYAGWAITLYLFLRILKLFVKAMSDLKDISLAKLENDVKTERTLEANADALKAVEHRLEKFCEAQRDTTTVLEKILLIKGSNVRLGSNTCGHSEDAEHGYEIVKLRERMGRALGTCCCGRV